MLTLEEGQAAPDCHNQPDCKVVDLDAVLSRAQLEELIAQPEWADLATLG